MNEKTIKRKTTDGLIWNTIQKLFSKGLQFLFSVLIARILLPEDYGLIAIANLLFLCPIYWWTAFLQSSYKGK